MRHDDAANRSNRLKVSHPLLAIFLVSVLGLFLEMLLIRWIGTEIRIFAYLQNTILVVCLLGLGLGCLTSRAPARLAQTVPPLLALVVLLSIPLTKKVFASISEMLSVLDDFLIWYQATESRLFVTTFWVVFALALTFFILLLVHDAFVPLGRLLGRLMDDEPHTIAAYSWNVFGSLLGIWAFVLLSSWYQPPLTWFLLAGALFLLLQKLAGGIHLRELLLIGAMIALLGWSNWNSEAVQTIWSPYQKLSLRKANPELGEIGDSIIDVNNVPYQGLIASVKASGSESTADLPPFGQYDLPLLLHPRPEHVLIVGAGAGNDAAGALRQSAGEVIAVEIDPGIYELGKKYHPDKPYSSPGVQMVVDDARSYFTNAKQRFEVISFGLLDSHTTTSLTNARLDHYVYTLESFQQAKSLLAEDGILTVSFVPQKPYIADRLAGVLRKVFGNPPLVLEIEASQRGWGGMMFVTGHMETVQEQLAAQPKVASEVLRQEAGDSWAIDYSTPIATDDWPYVYLKSRHIPLLFFLVGALMVGLFFRSVHHWEAGALFGNWDREHWHFFLLGAAFLLLEVTNISRSAVALGNTWLVNAIIVSGVLSMVLVANALASIFPRLPVLPFYVGLLLCCGLLLWINLSGLGFLPYGLRAVAVGGLAGLPMLFSGVVFIHSFAGTSHKDKALGANLFGALVGALLQSISFLTGIKSLLVVVALLYGLAALTRSRTKVQAPSLASPSEGMAGRTG